MPSSSPATAADATGGPGPPPFPGGRAFVHSSDPTLRDALGVRHDFGSFFSTVLEAREAAALRAHGIDVRAVGVWHLECHRASHARPGCDDEGGGGGGRGGGGGSEPPALRPRPSDPTPYGIGQVYNDAAVASTSGGAGLRLGHLDSGVHYKHPDLKNRIVACQSTAGSGCDDRNGHGTHTAGTAVADAGSDKLGIWGVAPEADLHVIRVCKNNGICFTDDIIAGIRACIAAGCDVITFSIGGSAASSAERAEVQAFVAAGGLFVAAAGNNGPTLDSMDHPGAFHETVAVGALDAALRVADFSSRGTNDDANASDEDGEVEFAAAGVNVESTWNDGAYRHLTGTRMATPHVAGLALKSWTGSGVATRVALAASVKDVTLGLHAGVGVDPASGWGLPHV